MTKIKAPPANRNHDLLAFLGTLVLFLALFQVLVFIFFSSQADTLTQINQEKEALTLENDRLEKEITQLTSLPTLEEKAQKIGFAVPNQQEGLWPSVIYLAEQLPIASIN